MITGRNGREQKKRKTSIQKEVLPFGSEIQLTLAK